MVGHKLNYYGTYTIIIGPLVSSLQHTPTPAQEIQSQTNMSNINNIYLETMTFKQPTLFCLARAPIQQVNCTSA